MLHSGDRLVLAGFGGGLTWGTANITWNKSKSARRAAFLIYLKIRQHQMNCPQENPYVLKESVHKPQIKASRLGAQGFH